MVAPSKILSGGQTGVARAALDIALELGLEPTGWCPKDRWAEDGRISASYALVETRAEGVHVQSQRNVEASSATLVITRGAPMGSERFTIDMAQSMRRPLLVVDLVVAEDPASTIGEWLLSVRPRALNVAGPRESGAPGIYEETCVILREALSRCVDLREDRTWLSPRPDTVVDGPWIAPHAGPADEIMAGPRARGAMTATARRGGLEAQ